MLITRVALRYTVAVMSDSTGSSTTAPATSKPPCRREDALAVLTRLRDAGHVAYFAGGCVRDELLGLHPADWDVATDAPPARVRALFPRTQAVGAAFGVILVREHQSTVEVATFRTDGGYADGRRPESVVFTTAEEDAKRRDFTINGLFLDPIAGRVIDFVGGQVDLRTRTLRAIGDADARFNEDHLRLLRAVRFAARFGLNYDPATRGAVVAHASRLARIAPERIADELRRMLVVPGIRQRAWADLRSLGLADVIFRQLPARANDPTREIFASLDSPAPIPFGLALASTAIELQIGTGVQDLRRLLEPAKLANTIRALRQSLRISNDEAELAYGALDFGPLLQDVRPSVAMLKRFLARPSSDASRALMLVLERLGLHADRLGWLREQFAIHDSTDVAPTPLLSGDDLIGLGWAPGRRFKRVLDEVYDAQLEHRVNTHDEAIALAQALAAD